jgi:hypothetical protein
MFLTDVACIGHYARLRLRDERTWSACGPNEANDPKPTLAEGARNTVS